METFLVGVLAGVLALLVAAVKFGVIRLDDLFHRILPRRPPPPAVPAGGPSEPEVIVEPEPPPAPPNYGNIRPTLGEERDPTEYGPEIHEFPENRPPETRFEDFNRRLFVWSPGPSTLAELPDTTLDDFPTRITLSNEAAMVAMINRNLRPRYPVILDEFGWWAHASMRLEMDPDFTDPIVEAYLAIPEPERPVVVSRTPALANAQLRFFRYGFTPWAVERAPLTMYPREFLSHIFAVLGGPRDGWLWMSVARMRHAVINNMKIAREEEEQRKFLQDEIRRKETEDAHGGNAWRTLWGLRPSMPPASLPEAAAPDAIPAADTPPSARTPGAEVAGAEA